MRVRAGRIAARGLDVESASLGWVRAVDIEDGRVVYESDPREEIRSFALSDDGRLIALRMEDTHRVVLVEVATGQPRAVLDGAPVDFLTRVCFAGSGGFVVLHGEEPFFTVWNTANGAATRHELPAVATCLCADRDSRIFVADESSTIHCFDRTTGELRARRQLPHADIVDVEADERAVWAATEDGYLVAWEPDTDSLRAVRVCRSAIERVRVEDGVIRLISESGAVMELESTLSGDPDEGRWERHP